MVEHYVLNKEYFQNLATELLLEIVGYLSPREQFRLAIAKKAIYHILQDALDKHKFLYEKYGLLELGNKNPSWIYLDTLTREPEIALYMESCQIISFQPGYLADEGVIGQPNSEDVSRWISLYLQSQLIQAMISPFISPTKFSAHLGSLIRQGDQGLIMARVLTLAVNIKQLDLVLSPCITYFLYRFLRRLSEEHRNHEYASGSSNHPFQQLQQVCVKYENELDDTRITWLYLFGTNPTLKRLAAHCVGQNDDEDEDEYEVAIGEGLSQIYARKANIEQLILTCFSNSILKKLSFFLEHINGLKTVYIQQLDAPSSSKGNRLTSLAEPVAEYHGESIQIFWLLNESARTIYATITEQEMNGMVDLRQQCNPLTFNKLRLLCCDWNKISESSPINLLVKSLEILY